ncbi:GL24516 [Drosophila persimilis]|uniref:GL24516 n=1 Tax=Drosophila persimilis TaxID=7234 RepID=B4GUK7_DROPE|nr:GL24516 [Drosophila persimilis]
MDMRGAKKSPDEAVPNPRPKRRSSYAGRTAPVAAIHGRGSIGSIGSIGSVSAGIYKAFRERFLSSDDSGDYRKLRQRDAEAGQQGLDPYQSSGSSGEEGEPSSSSSVEDLFASETERRQWRRRSAGHRRRGPGRKKLLAPVLLLVLLA